MVFPSLSRARPTRRELVLLPLARGVEIAGIDLPSRNKTVDLDREPAHLARGDDAIGHPLSIQAGHAGVDAASWPVGAARKRGTFTRAHPLLMPL
jgi:hypothetical protein